ncbi:MAG: hypothetical protein HY904_26570 [Deltaproteobacteria bacterium]|nr:hypothetical protein [Deltaproteobacteria bacterium]
MHLAPLLLALAAAPAPDFRLAPPWERDDTSLRLSVETAAGTSEPVSNRNTVRGTLVVDGVRTGVTLDGGSLRNRPLPDGSQLFSYWNRSLFRWDPVRRTLDPVGDAMQLPLHAVFPERSPGALLVVDRDGGQTCVAGLAPDYRSVVRLWCTGPGERPLVQAATRHGAGFCALVVRSGSHRSVITVEPGRDVVEVPLPDALDGLIPIGLDAVRGSRVALVDQRADPARKAGDPFRAEVRVFDADTGRVVVVGGALGAWRNGNPHVHVEWIGAAELARRRYRSHDGDMNRAMNLLVDESLQLLTVVPQ